MHSFSTSKLLVAWVLVAWNLNTLRAQPPQQPATVVVAPIIQREVSAGQTFVGAVVPTRRSVIGSAVDGRVAEVFVDEGDAVHLLEPDETGKRRGQPIAQILTDTISIEIEAARADMLLRQHELEEMEAGSRPEEIAQAKARLGATQALMEFAKSRFDRTKALFEQAKTASLDELEQALSSALATEQNRIAAQAEAELVIAGPRQEQIAQARARLAMATEQVNRLESMKAKYTLRTPFEGYVVAKQTEIGAWVSRGDPVAEIIELDPIEIDATVPEAFIAHVRIDAAVHVRADAVPGQVFTGKVHRVIPQADLRSRTFPVKIRLANPPTVDGHLLKSGMLARVTLAVGPPTQAMLVPKDSLVLGGPQPLLMVVTSPDTKTTTVRAVPVQLGIAEGSLIQVIGDVMAGQQVVVVGNERIRPGQPIEPILASGQSASADRKNVGAP